MPGHLRERDRRLFCSHPPIRWKADRADRARIDDPLRPDFARGFHQKPRAGHIDIIKNIRAFGPERIVRRHMIELLTVPQCLPERGTISQIAVHLFDM